MTTITINENINWDKTEFKNLQEFINYLLKKEPIGVLLPLNEDEITPQREERFKKALNTPKSEMLNI
jgi:myosin heavy subunit